jgi:DnaJ-class molecular chaperone
MEIKKSYRKLSMEYHSDKNRAPGAEQRNWKAHDIHSDHKKKQIYDQHR